jgi:hypothetical protein
VRKVRRMRRTWPATEPRCCETLLPRE